MPSGLTSYTTGPAALGVDFGAAFGGIDGILLLVALLVVFVILLVVYRSLLLPILVLLTSTFALTGSILIVYLLAKADIITVTGQSQGILSILALGAATDYSLLLVARFREALVTHRTPWAAMRVALRVGGRADRGVGGDRDPRRALPAALGAELEPRARPGRRDRHLLRAARGADRAARPARAARPHGVLAVPAEVRRAGGRRRGAGEAVATLGRRRPARLAPPARGLDHLGRAAGRRRARTAAAAGQRRAADRSAAEPVRLGRRPEAAGEALRRRLGQPGLHRRRSRATPIGWSRWRSRRSDVADAAVYTGASGGAPGAPGVRPPAKVVDGTVLVEATLVGAGGLRRRRARGHDPARQAARHRLDARRSAG